MLVPNILSNIAVEKIKICTQYFDVMQYVRSLAKDDRTLKKALKSER